MKSRIFLLIIVLLSTLQISFANNKIDTYLALKKEIEEVDFKPYETILTTSEDDEFVKILIKSTPKKIKEIVVISLYSDEINVVRCKGNLKSDMLEKSKTN